MKALHKEPCGQPAVWEDIGQMAAEAETGCLWRICVL